MLGHFDGPTMTVVVNPHAGRGRAKKLLPQIVAHLVQALPDTHVQVHQTTNYDDARLRTIRAVERARPTSQGGPGDSLVVVGGDGMAHLGVNACAGTDVTLGVIPAGTGNDFCRGVGIPTKVRAATRLIGQGHAERIDLVKADGALVDGATSRYVGCSISSGYDAKVNIRANALTLPLGSLAYAYSALTELAVFEPLSYRLTIDGQPWHEPAMLVAVSNSAYIGGGIKISPKADVTDAHLDLTLVSPVSRATLLRLLPELFTGSFVRDPAVELVRARTVTIDGDDMVAMADGEHLGELPITASVAPRVLSLYRTRDPRAIDDAPLA